MIGREFHPFGLSAFVRYDTAMTPVRVVALWDAEAGVWVAESPDVPGLITEAQDLEALLAKLRVMVPELAEENGLPLTPPLELHLEARQALTPA